MVLKEQTNKKKCMKQIKQKLNHKKQKKTIMTTAKMQHIGRKKIGFLSQNVYTVE